MKAEKTNTARRQPPQIARVEPLADWQTRLVRKGVSQQGRRVTLTQECGRYDGARPYFMVAYHREDGRPQVVRYTPYAERAEWLFRQLCADEMDLAALVHDARRLHELRAGARPPDRLGRTMRPVAAA
jgi:hypothetical protein